MSDKSQSEGTQGGRGRLLTAAHELFPSHGYRAVTVAQLLQLSGVQAPTLYHHFSDKEGLYVEWVGEALSEFGHRLREAAASQSSLYLRLHACALVLIDETSPDLLQIRRDASLMRNPENREANYRHLFAQVYEPIMTLIVVGIGEGLIAPHPIDRLAHLFIGLSMSFRAGYTLQTMSTATLADWIVEGFLHGFGMPFRG